MLEQIRRQQPVLAQQGIGLRVVGLANSRQMALSRDGLDLDNWPAALEKAEQENLALKLEGYREEEKRSAQAQLEAIRAQIAREKQIAQTEIANEREAAIREMRKEVVNLSMAVAEKLLKKNIDSDMNAKLVADCIDQIQTQRVKGN